MTHYTLVDSNNTKLDNFSSNELPNILGVFAHINTFHHSFPGQSSLILIELYPGILFNKSRFILKPHVVFSRTGMISKRMVLSNPSTYDYLINTWVRASLIRNRVERPNLTPKEVLTFHIETNAIISFKYLVQKYFTTSDLLDCAILAIQYGRTEILRYIISITKKSYDLYFPYTIGAIHSLEMIKLFITEGCRDSEVINMLISQAHSHGFYEVVLYLGKTTHNQNKYVLFANVVKGLKAEVESLLKSLDINCHLHKLDYIQAAIDHNHMEILKLLIEEIHERDDTFTKKYANYSGFKDRIEAFKIILNANPGITSNALFIREFIRTYHRKESFLRELVEIGISHNKILENGPLKPKLECLFDRDNFFRILHEISTG